jgi:hypothetical protein
LRRGHLTTGSALVLIAALTLKSQPEQPALRQLSPWCIACGETGGTDLVLNTLLFVPLGIGLAGLRWSLALAIAVGAGVSLAIETLQATILTGRHGTVGDVAANTLGTLAGFAMARAADQSPLAVRALVARWGLPVGLTMALGPAFAPVLLQPASVVAEPWYGQWAHVFENTEPFTGKLLRVTLNGAPVPDGALTTAEGRGPPTRLDRLEINVDLRLGQPTHRRAQVAAIADPHGSWVVAIWQHDTDAILATKLQASRVRMVHPVIRLRGALAGNHGDERRLALRIIGGTITAQADGGEKHAAVLRLDAGLGWTLFWPWEASLYRDPPARNLAWMWGWGAVAVGTLLAWIRNRTSTRRLADLVGLLPLAACLGVSAGLGIPLPMLSELAALAAGSLTPLIGIHLSAWRRSREGR